VDEAEEVPTSVSSLSAAAGEQRRALAAAATKARQQRQFQRRQAVFALQAANSSQIAALDSGKAREP
jgi:hypothetical protein